jgi:hypothetical protein
MFCLIFLLGHTVLVTELMARPSIYQPDLIYGNQNTALYLRGIAVDSKLVWTTVKGVTIGKSNLRQGITL